MLLPSKIGCTILESVTLYSMNIINSTREYHGWFFVRNNLSIWVEICYYHLIGRGAFGFFLFFYFFISEPEGEITKNAGTAIPRAGPLYHPQQIQIITFVLLLRETWPPSLVQLGCILKGKTYNLRVYTRWIWKPKG